MAIRPWYLYGFLLGLFGLGLAFYLQTAEGISPCSLCMLSRIILLLLIILFLLAFIHNPRCIGKWIYISLTMLFSLLGLTISLRHVWLQHLPASVTPVCDPGFDYLFQTLPFFTALDTILKGSGECTQVLWSFFGLSLPAWGGVGFSLMFIISILPILEYRRNK